MKELKSQRAGMIGCAIGTAVIELSAKGIPLNRANILYELERIAAASKELPVRAIAKDAANLLRRGCN